MQVSMGVGQAKGRGMTGKVIACQEGVTGSETT